MWARHITTSKNTINGYLTDQSGQFCPQTTKKMTRADPGATVSLAFASTLGFLWPLYSQTILAKSFQRHILTVGSRWADQSGNFRRKIAQNCPKLTARVVFLRFHYAFKLYM